MQLVFRLTGAIVVLTLVVQVQLNINWHGSPGAALWSMSKFFTIWTAALAAVVCLAAPRRSSPHLITATTLYSVMVGCVYHLLLAADHHPQGIGVITNAIFHTVLPITLAVLWWIGQPHRQLTGLAPLVWLPFPLAYLAWIMIRGEVTGNYPYFFLDAARLGYAGALGNATVLTGIFLVLGRMTVSLDRRLTPEATPVLIRPRPRS